ncbi:hypothetical protein Hanom_Chr14g01332741 [Helianthus anomalus]
MFMLNKKKKHLYITFINLYIFHILKTYSNPTQTRANGLTLLTYNTKKVH